jgi:hypothetical protein
VIFSEGITGEPSYSSSANVNTIDNAGTSGGPINLIGLMNQSCTASTTYSGTRSPAFSD